MQELYLKYQLWNLKPEFDKLKRIDWAALPKDKSAFDKFEKTRKPPPTEGKKGSEALQAEYTKPGKMDPLRPGNYPTRPIVHRTASDAAKSEASKLRKIVNNPDKPGGKVGDDSKVKDEQPPPVKLTNLPLPLKVKMNTMDVPTGSAMLTKALDAALAKLKSVEGLSKASEVVKIKTAADRLKAHVDRKLRAIATLNQSQRLKDAPLRDPAKQKLLVEMQQLHDQTTTRFMNALKLHAGTEIESEGETLPQAPAPTMHSEAETRAFHILSRRGKDAPETQDPAHTAILARHKF